MVKAGRVGLAQLEHLSSWPEAISSPAPLTGRKNKGALDIGTLNFPKRDAGGRKWMLASFCL